MDIFEIIQALGTIAFAISGGLAGIERKLDYFGVLVVSFVTALGGGMLRDVLIGQTPVLFMKDINYFYYVMIGYVISILVRNFSHYLHKSLFLFDAVGLGVFTIVGIQKGQHIGLDPAICIALGTMTACFGGVVRDILMNEIPVLFRKEIYATLCILGGMLYFILEALDVSRTSIYLIVALFIILSRLIVVKYKLTLPAFTKSDSNTNHKRN